MLFNSPDFLFGFLPVVFAGYLLLLRFSAPLTKLWIVAASLVFYAWFEPWHLLWLTISMIVNCGLSLPLSRLPRGKRKQALLWIGIASNLGMLFHFKYSEFAGSIFGGWFDQTNTVSNTTLPLAISFVTFTQIAYLVDVYRQETYRGSPLDYGFVALFFSAPDCRADSSARGVRAANSGKASDSEVQRCASGVVLAGDRSCQEGAIS